MNMYTNIHTSIALSVLKKIFTSFWQWFNMVPGFYGSCQQLKYPSTSETVKLANMAITLALHLFVQPSLTLDQCFSSHPLFLIEIMKRN